jgi:hypothetical protein
MTYIEMLFIQTQKLPPSTHHKWKETIDFTNKTTNEKSIGTNSHRKVPLDLSDDW